MIKRLKEANLSVGGEAYKDARMRVLDALNLINKAGDTIISVRIAYKSNPVQKAKKTLKKKEVIDESHHKDN